MHILQLLFALMTVTLWFYIFMLDYGNDIRQKAIPSYCFIVLLILHSLLGPAYLAVKPKWDFFFFFKFWNSLSYTEGGGHIKLSPCLQRKFKPVFGLLFCHLQTTQHRPISQSVT